MERTVFTGGLIYNSAFRRFFPADMLVEDGWILAVCEQLPERETEHCVDLQGRRVVPGLIDIHMHIESSMLTPMVFAGLAAQHGVTTVVSEPHEMANVFGLDGILAMIDNGRDAPVDIFYGIPSSVPSTNFGLETPGGEIGLAEGKRLLQLSQVRCLGEVMNTRDVLDTKENRTKQLIAAAAAAGLPVEGHCPGLSERQLHRYLAAGVDSDHTEHTMTELEQRYRAGMFMEIQEKMLRREVIDYIVAHGLYGSTAFVTDDVLPDHLVEKGHLDYVVRCAVKLGMRLEDAVWCATYTPAARMRLYDRGTLAPGKRADFAVLEPSDEFAVSAVYKNGRPVKTARRRAAPFPGQFYDSVHVPPLTQKDFAVPAPAGDGTVLCRVMETFPDRTQTAAGLTRLPVENGQLVWQGGQMLCACAERHGADGHRAFGLAKGCCMMDGAVATTYAHDHHNLFVMGSAAADMAVAANEVVRLCGGIATAQAGKITARLPLPVAGILSDAPPEETAQAMRQVREQMTQMGYRHANPVMSLCTLSLPCSPALKLTDKGLVDVAEGKLVPLFCEEE